MPPWIVLPLLLLGIAVLKVDGSHFRGAIIMVRPTGNVSYPNLMEISYQISWRRGSSEGGSCNDATISSGVLIGSGDLRCTAGCSGSISRMSYQCTDYSSSENWSFGERRLEHSFTSTDGPLTIEFSGNAWISPFNSDWRIPTTFSMQRRNDTGKINSTPRAKTAPVVRLQEGCNHTLKLVVSDPDNDVVRCRWASGSECGGICQRFPGATLDPDTCSFQYSAVQGTGYKAAAIMLEDFLPGSTTPLSSVALQFLILVFPSDSLCSSKPFPSPSTIPHGSCVAVPKDSTLFTQITMASGGEGVSITEIQTVSPRGMSKGSLEEDSTAKLYHVNISWTPSEDQQDQVHQFCFTGRNSAGLSSDQACIQFMVGPDPPKMQPSTNSPDDIHVHPSETTWSVKFDKDVEQPTISGYIKYKEYNTDQEVYVIDASSSQEIDYVSSNEIKIKPMFTFEEKVKFFIEVGRGVVVGLDGCGPGNEPMTDRTFWTFTTLDVTPPILWFLNAPTRTNENVTLTWSSNEQIEQECLFISSADTKEVGCNGSRWSISQLEEGTYQFIIDASDEAGNPSRLTHTFYVDRTPPVTTITQAPQEFTNKRTTTLSFLCNEADTCSFECIFYDVAMADMEVLPCNSAKFSTPAMEPDSEYLFEVRAIDSVGNRGLFTRTTWIIDVEAPNLVDIPDASVDCTEELTYYGITSTTGHPTVQDNRDTNPMISYKDQSHSCYISRTWTAHDKAGNTASSVQNITLTFQPTINALPVVSFTCDSASGDISIPSSTGSAHNPCGRNLESSYSDSVSELKCPVSFTRTWRVLDTCSLATANLTQKVVVNDVCPSHACGRNFSEPHGVCSFGECSCIKPWYGEECTQLIYEPLVKNMDSETIQEGQDYTAGPQLQQGTEPITWSLTSGPERMVIDIRRGTINWPRAIAGSHEIKIKVQNQVGEHEISWTLVVRTTYSATLNPQVVTSDGAFQLQGTVKYEQSSIIRDRLAGFVPVNIDVVAKETTRTFLIYTKSDGTFSTTFIPTQGEYGVFTAQARHPGENPGAKQVEWSILGMQVTPSNININGESTGSFQKMYSNVATVLNDGPGLLKNLRADASLGSLASHIRAKVYLNGVQSLPQLGMGQNCTLSIDIETTRPLKASFFVQIKSDTGVTKYVNVFVNILHILPQFVIDPPSLNTRVTRSETKLFQFNVTNIGRVDGTSVSVNIPENEFVSLVGFGTSAHIGNNLVLKSGESVSLDILVQIPSNQKLGELKGTITIYSQETAKSIPFQLLVSSNVLMDLTVKVEDEYTYFAEGKPLVDNALVRLDNYARNIHLSDGTDASGTVTFKNIPEDRYELFLSAPKHQNEKRVIITDPNKPEITVFLERTGVSYHFSVTPVEIEDTYQIQLEADFETQIPMPVVTVSPRQVDLTDIELGLVDMVQFNVTNHGLIRAENVSFEPPTGHPFLKFKSSIKNIGSLEAQSSLIIPVTVERSTRQKRYWIWVAFGFKVGYSYLCGSWQFRNALGVFKRREWRDDGPTRIKPKVNWPSGGGSCCSGGFNFGGYSASTFDFCDPCLQAFVSCIPTPKIPGLGCLPQLAGGPPKGFLNTVINVAGWLDCIPGTRFTGKIDTCIPGIINGCLLSGGNSRRKKRALKDSVRDLAEAMYPIIQSEELAIEILGSDLWIKIGDPEWYSNVLTPVLDDSSDAGPMVSQDELERIRNTEPPIGATLNETTLMVMRLNNTLSSWGIGYFEPEEGENMASYAKYESLLNTINDYNEKAKGKGFTSYLDAYSFAASQINRASSWEEEEGICAVVRIRIQQEAALTREGFLARLDIENKEIANLNDIEVELLIRDGSTGDVATTKFSIGDATLSGSLSAVDGTGVLSSNADGTAEWLIIPYSEAAPAVDKEYDVGGNLKYSVDGEKISITLTPSSITVKPDPSLRVHYFWAKNVISDDPFTDAKEPAVPFALGVAVKNAGYGTAFNMRITSAQPEIISNEKGLLVTFKIIGSSVGLTQESPSLTVTFGDITPNTTKVARWWMISSLQGEFKNFSATFENTNPLGDPKLSLIDELEIHQLIQNVRLYGVEEDDGVLDFLTNEEKDLYDFPDTLYSSNSLTPYNVSAGIIQSVKKKNTIDGVNILISAASNTSGLTYFRSGDLKHILTLPTLLSLASTRLQDGTDLPPENTWLTVSQRKDKSVYLHFLDLLPHDGIFEYEIKLCDKDCMDRNDTLGTGIPLLISEEIYTVKDNFTIPMEPTTTYFEFTTQNTKVTETGPGKTTQHPNVVETGPPKTSGSQSKIVVRFSVMFLIFCVIHLF